MTDVTHREHMFNTRMLGWADGAAGKPARSGESRYGTAYLDGYSLGQLARSQAIEEASEATEFVVVERVPRATEVMGYS